MKFIKQINSNEAVVFSGSVYKHQMANDYATIKTKSTTKEVTMRAMTKDGKTLRLDFFCEDSACLSEMLTKFRVDIENPKNAMGTAKYKKMLRCPTIWIHSDENNRINHWYFEGRLDMVG